MCTRVHNTLGTVTVMVDSENGASLPLSLLLHPSFPSIPWSDIVKTVRMKPALLEILSRDEAYNPQKKTHHLFHHLFMGLNKLGRYFDLFSNYEWEG